MCRMRPVTTLSVSLLLTKTAEKWCESIFIVLQTWMSARPILMIYFVARLYTNAMTYVNTRTAIERLGVSDVTLRRWDKLEAIPTIRTPGGQRLYDIETFKQTQALRSEKSRIHARSLANDKRKASRIDIGYARVSFAKQKEDLGRQEQFIRDSRPGISILSDTGSGLNFKRKSFKKLLRCIMQGQVDRVLVAYKDRLCRFAFEIIQLVCDENNTELVVLNQSKNGSPETELMEDLMAVVHVFSSRLYGKRSTGKRKRNTTGSPQYRETPTGSSSTKDCTDLTMVGSFESSLTGVPDSEDGQTDSKDARQCDEENHGQEDTET